MRVHAGSSLAVGLAITGLEWHRFWISYVALGGKLHSC